MNTDTASLIQRPFQEVVDDLLTSIVGGVVNEAVIYDVGQDVYPLSRPASALRSVTGTRALPGTGELAHHTFRVQIDFELDEAQNAVAWLDDGVAPADETEFYVDYFQPGSRSPITDTNTGSVTRTLAEAIGREIATVYQQINEAYRAGFLDTAKGQSLDLVVSILGVERKLAESAQALVSFYRAPAEDGTITIRAGLQLRTKRGAAFETTEIRTMQRGQTRVDIPVRAARGYEGDKGDAKAGEITELSEVVEGIDHVANLDATIRPAEAESDEELRTRARARLRGLGKGTVAAIVGAVADQRAKVVDVWDPNSTSQPSTPGTLSLLVESEPNRFPAVQEAVHDTRAAGVLAAVVARYVYFTPRLKLKAAVLTPAGREKLLGEVIDKATAYVGSLGAGVPATGGGLVDALKECGTVEFAEVMAWRMDAQRPGTDALVDAVVDVVSDAAGDAALLRTSLRELLGDGPAAAPTVARIADRSLVQGPTGAPPTAEEVRTGTFSVAPPTEGGAWFVVLDMETSDVVFDGTGP